MWASTSGNTVPAIARLVTTDEDTVREVIQGVNVTGLAVLEPHPAGGYPRRITDEDIDYIGDPATTRPKSSGRRSPLGACANSPPTCTTTPFVSW
ncbi:hypothetical protein ACIP5Y_07090 [Nocardia sp. NPDC088792]|uniref:hypothetical protein n=1 Tax=Nocardia sp. NPDC088792 TaxID=3364332 RepID=UPI003813EF64